MTVFRVWSHPGCYLLIMFGRFCTLKDKYIFVHAQFWRHFPNVLWEQKALFLTVYRWLAKNKREVWAWLNRTAAENSDHKPCFFHKLCFERYGNEACSKLMLPIKAVVRRKPCLISILLTCSLKVHSLSVIISESFLVFRFQPWSHGLWWVFFELKGGCNEM